MPGATGNGSDGWWAGVCLAGLLVILTEGYTAAAAEPRSLKGHGGPVKALALDPTSDVLLSGSFDYSFRSWLVKDGADTPGLRFDDVGGAINAVGFAGDRFVAGGDDGALHVVGQRDGTRQARLEGHTHKINAIDVAPDGRRVVTASWDRTARIWDLEAADPAAGAIVLEGHTAPVNAAVFSSDGATVFTASGDGELRAFDAATGRFKRPILRNGWGLNVLVRVPDSNWLAFGAVNGGVGLIDTVNTETVKTLASHEKPTLALAAAGGRLATAGADGVIRVWDTTTLAPVEEFKNPFGPIWSLALTGDGKTAFYGGLDDVVHVWQVTPRKPFEPVESAFPRRFQVESDSDDPIERGRIQFARKCSVCHTLTADGGNRAGPTLYRIFGRPIASLNGYRFSEPLKELDIVWTPETVSKLFEIGPDKYTPGSKMPLQVISDPAERAALVAYLEKATVSTETKP